MPKCVELPIEENGKVPAYAWPGGYGILYYTDDGGTLCPDCVNANLDLCKDKDDPQWHVFAWDIYYEGPSLYCDNCGKELESEYGDPEEEKEVL